jgi:hypothetical protein
MASICNDEWDRLDVTSGHGGLPLSLIVDRAALEGLDRKVLVRGHEDDVHLAREAPRDFDAAGARVADVEKGDVRRVAEQLRQCFVAIAGLAARRMSQTAAHLVDHVIPHVPVRQWVLSLPIPLRVLLAAQPERVTLVLQVVQRALTRHLRAAAGLTGLPSRCALGDSPLGRPGGLKADAGHGGAVTLIPALRHGRQPQHPPALPGAVFSNSGMSLERTAVDVAKRVDLLIGDAV